MQTIVTTVFVLLVFFFAILFLGSMCAVWKRMENTPFDKKPHSIVLGSAVFQALLLNCAHRVTDRWDDLLELVVGHYLYAYELGAKDVPIEENHFNKYVRRHLASKPFHNMLVRCMRSAYRNGKNK